MLFTNKKCEKCSSEYDPAEICCPRCNEPNHDYNAKKISTGALWLPVLQQVILFIIGFIGLQIFAYILLSIYKNIPGLSNETILLAVTDFSAYGLLLFALLLVLFPFRKKVFKNLKNPSAYLFGIAGGFAVYFFSIIYGTLIQSISGVGSNDNQNILVEIIGIYPVLSLIVFGIVGPICEELTYRVGFFNLLSRIGRIPGLILTSILFGLIHFSFTGDLVTELLNLPDYIIVGFIFCFLYDKKGLGCSVTAHVINNVISIVLIIAAKQLGA